MFLLKILAFIELFCMLFLKLSKLNKQFQSKRKQNKSTEDTQAPNQSSLSFQISKFLYIFRNDMSPINKLVLYATSVFVEDMYIRADSTLFLLSPSLFLWIATHKPPSPAQVFSHWPSPLFPPHQMPILSNSE